MTRRRASGPGRTAWLYGLILVLQAAACPAMAGTIRTDVEILSSPDYGGRGIGTHGAAKSADYLAGRLQDLGLVPLTGLTFRQPVGITGVTLAGPAGDLSLDGKVLAQIGTTLVLSQGVTGPRTIDAPVVLVRYSAASVALPDVFLSSSLDGAILILERVDAPGTPMPEAASGVLAALSAMRPAVVLNVMPDLIKMPDGSSEAPIVRYALDSPGDAMLNGLVDAQAVYDVFNPPGGPDDYQTVSIDRPTAPGRLELSFATSERRTLDEANIAATLTGHADAAPILLAAHYDHLGVIEGQIFPGADDNASGVAVVLKVLQGLASDPPGAPVDVVFFTGEEHGLLGSRAFVANAPRPLAQYSAVLNLDSVGRAMGDRPDLKRTVFSSGLDCFPEIRAALQDGAAASGMTVAGFDENPVLAPLYGSCKAQRAGTGGAPSDHLPFVMAGSDAVILTGGLHKDYHQPGDTAAKLDYDRLNALATLVEVAVRHLARGHQ